MCYIMIGKQLKEPSEKTKAIVSRVLAGKMSTNDDGFFLKDSVGELRTLNDKKFAKRLDGVDYSNFMVHFRLISTGIQSEENVHGWTDGDWQFAHNGMIFEYSFDKAQEHTDSYLLFKDILHNIEFYEAETDEEIAVTIQDVMATCSFWGRASLYNSKTDKTYLLGDWYCYLFEEEYLAISSHQLTFYGFDDKGKKDIHGIEFSLPSNAPTFEKIDGIHVIKNSSKPDFEISRLKFFLTYKNARTSRQVYTVCEQLLEQIRERKAIEAKKAEEPKEEEKETEKASKDLANDMGDIYITNDRGYKVLVVLEEDGMVHDYEYYCCGRGQQEHKRMEEILFEEDGFSKIWAAELEKANGDKKHLMFH